MSSQKAEIVKGLLRELREEEDALEKANGDLNQAQTRFDVISRKYAAIRDMVTKYLGESPYQDKDYFREIIGEPVYDERGNVVDFNETDVKFYGSFRFIHMNIGNAVVAVLKEADEAIDLETIVKRLKGGGIKKSDTYLNRAVNAALMKTKSIEKTKDGKYMYIQTVGDNVIEDLPFKE